MSDLANSIMSSEKNQELLVLPRKHVAIRRWFQATTSQGETKIPPAIYSFLVDEVDEGMGKKNEQVNEKNLRDCFFKWYDLW